METKNMTWSETLHDITVGGIDFETMEGYGGPECKNFSSLERRIVESLLYFMLSFIAIVISKKLHSQTEQSVPKTIMCNGNNNHIPKGKIYHEKTSDDYSESYRTVVLFSYAMVNGIELGYKILETTLYYQAGPLAAILYPATEARLWTFEVYSYYIHHVFLLLIPIYLHHAYSEKPRGNNNDNHGDNKIKNIPILQNPFNLSWLLHSYGVWMFCTVFIHWISYYTMANINVSLCPQDGVPGYGDNYRVHSFYHLLFFHLLSASIYAGMIRFSQYLSHMISGWNKSNTKYTSINGHCETSRRKIEKEE